MNWPIPESVRAQQVIGALLVPGATPDSVGALFDALGVELDESTLAENAGTGTIVQPANAVANLPKAPVNRIVARYTFDAAREAPIATLAALRERRLVFFAVTSAGSKAIGETLEALAGPPTKLSGVRGDDYFVYPDNWVHTQRSGVLGWFEQLPDWLRLPEDDDCYEVLQEFAHAVETTSTLEELRAVVSSMPEPYGLILRAERVDRIEIAFVPPIPAKVLVSAFQWQSVGARLLANEGWTLGTIDHGSSCDEPGRKRNPSMIGPWVATPRLEHPPTGGALSDGRWHAFHTLDVVASMTLSLRHP